MHFIVIYVIEAHPTASPSPYSGKEWTTEASVDKEGCSLLQPATYEERVTQAAQMAEQLGITIPILIDEMDNPLWSTYGPSPNIAYLIGTDGRIVEKEGWYEPELMKATVETHLTGTSVPSQSQPQATRPTYPLSTPEIELIKTIAVVPDDNYRTGGFFFWASQSAVSPYLFHFSGNGVRFYFTVMLFSGQLKPATIPQ